MLPRSIAVFFAVALASCGATGTEPTLSDAKAGTPVAKPTASFIQAQAFATFIPSGTVNWELFVARYATNGQRPDSTILIVDHCPQDCEVTDPSEVTVVSVARFRIGTLRSADGRGIGSCTPPSRGRAVSM